MKTVLVRLIDDHHDPRCHGGCCNPGPRCSAKPCPAPLFLNSPIRPGETSVGSAATAVESTSTGYASPQATPKMRPPPAPFCPGFTAYRPELAKNANSLQDARLDCEPRPNLVDSQTRHSDYLSAAGLAGSNSNGGAGHLQKIRKEFDASLVGLALDRRRDEDHFECVAQFSGDGVPVRAGMHLDRERHSAGSLLDGDQEFFASEKIVSATSTPCSSSS